ncbi:MAG: glycosyltransferase family 2 protein [Marinirhabdus sp.]
MKTYVVIPAHNEGAYLAKTLLSLVGQSVPPQKIIVVNDASTDGTAGIIKRFMAQYPIISTTATQQGGEHGPGSNVVRAFKQGLALLDDGYDIICKFDADLLFPPNYLETVQAHFKKNPACGIAGGFCYIEKNGRWALENLTGKDHVRGALKAYRKACFKEMGGLKTAMGWDTADELLAQYHGWEVTTDGALHVKHLKPTGANYPTAAKYKQGEAFYKLRYGTVLTAVALAKLAYLKGDLSYFTQGLKGYRKAERAAVGPLVNIEQGAFIRKLRWRKIREKLGLGTSIL